MFLFLLSFPCFVLSRGSFLKVWWILYILLKMEKFYRDFLFFKNISSIYLCATLFIRGVKKTYQTENVSYFSTLKF